MRKGDNPVRNKRIDKAGKSHVIIIPYFISEEAYFLDTLNILEHCLKSLKTNSVYDFSVHLVANGSRSVSIENKLVELHQQGFIDDLTIITRPVGKVNAILSVLRNVRSPYVTVTDADVLFLPEWDKHVFDVFKNFTKAAAVSPVPIFRTHNRLTANIWYDYFFSNKLRFENVVDKESMTRYAKSIGWPWLDEKFKTKYMTLRSNSNLKAVVGNGHFCVTYNNSVFKALPYENSEYILGGNSEFKFLDQPAVLTDGYRLSTLTNHAYHMGNRLEPWMLKLAAEFTPVQKERLNVTSKIFKNKKRLFFIKFKVFKTLLVKFRLLESFYKLKGLMDKELDIFK